MYLRDELIFDFDEEGIVNSPMSFEIVEVLELLLILQLYNLSRYASTLIGLMK